MSITYYEHNDGIKLMAKMLYEEKLTPIIGSGFTKDCPSKKSTVPDGNMATELMKDIISKFRDINLVGADFNKTSDRFFTIVPKEKQWEFFDAYFTGVNIPDYLSAFLSLPWTYIYTLNIDDGIERTGLYTPVLPYQNANVPNISMKLDSFIIRLQGIVERIPVSKGEKSRHAGEKLVHNSKYYLLSLMRNLSNEEIVSTVKYIVSKLSKDKARKRLYIETVLFDTLNQLFGHTKGAGKLILDIYEALEPHLNQDMDYWLQRSKSIYRIYPKSYTKLKTAYQYAKKAASDGDSRIQAKAALTTSLICCLLAKQCRDERDKHDFEIEAITSAETAITSAYFRINRKNLKDELGIGRRESYFDMIVRVCNKHSDPSENLQIAWKATGIKRDIVNLGTSD